MKKKKMTKTVIGKKQLPFHQTNTYLDLSVTAS